MDVSRRNFLKLVGTATAGVSLTGVGAVKAPAAARESLRIAYAKEVHTVCTYCGVGCGLICHVRDGVIINVEGDPDHPVNEGTLCSKGQSHFNVSYVIDRLGRPKPNPKRLTRPLYRGKGESKYREVSWDWALSEIAGRVKDTRDRTFETTVDVNGRPVTVNRTKAISWLGSAFCTNEENYLFHKFTRGLGLIAVDHCARL